MIFSSGTLSKSIKSFFVFSEITVIFSALFSALLIKSFSVRRALILPEPLNKKATRSWTVKKIFVPDFLERSAGMM